MIEDRHIDVGAQRLHAHIGGVDGALPTIVLEAGGGSILPTWSGVEQALAAQTRVLSYERAGIGESSGPVDSVSAAAVARRLDTLLEASDIRGPLILVGHSLGGLYMRYYAQTRADRVAGLVLLDTTPQDLPFARFFTVKPTLVLWLLHGLARVGVLQWLVKSLTPSGKTAELSAEHLAALSRFRHVKTVLGEIGALRQIQAEVTALPPALALPTLTISAGRHDKRIKPAQAEHFRRSHEQLAERGAAPFSHHQRMQDATHMSMLTDPSQAAIVAATILDFARQLAQKARA
ncbi:alpha/beta fold hydrolase [Hydrocarboniphaga sp.]|uniref:alpha/beta fold hydrolase n=1 Tax=Hydrocarboniphaga sp. TaxID=2033016 RepID=UPI003D10BCBF